VGLLSEDDITTRWVYLKKKTAETWCNAFCIFMISINATRLISNYNEPADIRKYKGLLPVAMLATSLWLYVMIEEEQEQKGLYRRRSGTP
jgi:hypothetical protein